MIRFVFIITIFLAILAGVYFLSQYPVTVTFETPLYQLEPSFGFVVLAGLIASFLLFLFWRVLELLIRLPKKLRLSAQRKRHEKGLIALENAFIASAEDEKNKAQKEVTLARKYLKERSALTHLLTAYIAESNQKTDLARQHYEALLADPKTELSARRGLAITASRQGRLDEALHHAEKAYTTKTHPLWAFKLLFDTEIVQGGWNKALSILEKGQKFKQISPEIAQRRSAVILTALAAEQNHQNDRITAKETLMRALKKSPGFAPAAALATQILVKQGESRKARQILESAWADNPHPALALAYRDLKENETPKARYKRFLNLTKLNKTHRETRLLMAEQALAINDIKNASETLNDILENEGMPSSRMCQLMAQLAERKGQTEEAEKWMQKMAYAPIEENWSDLDPEGSGFAYTPEDWKRLVYSYGDNGVLIYPRHERFGPVLQLDLPVSEKKEKEGKEGGSVQEEKIQHESPAKKTDPQQQKDLVEEEISQNKEKTSKETVLKETVILSSDEDIEFRQPDDPGVEIKSNKS